MEILLFLLGQRHAKNGVLTTKVYETRSKLTPRGEKKSHCRAQKAYQLTRTTARVWASETVQYRCVLGPLFSKK